MPSAMSWRIRAYAEGDLQAVTDIYNESVTAGGVTADLVPRTLNQRREWVDSHAPRGAYPVLVLEEGDGRIAGFSSISRFLRREAYDGVAELSYYVARDRWHRGYGAALLEDLLDRARSIGHRKVVTLIFDGNAGSTALMEKYGFERFGLLHDAAFDGRRYLDLAYWHLDLNG